MTSTRKGLVANIVIGLALVAFGVLLLLEAVFRIDIWGMLWPLFVLGPGLALFAVMIARGRGRGGALAVPASNVTMVGLILFVQNILDLWATWAYAWALIAPTSIGLGLLIQGWWDGDGRRSAEGRRMVSAGLFLFLTLLAFFELVLNLSGMVPRVVTRYLGPLVVIALGVVLMIRALFASTGTHRPSVSPEEPFRMPPVQVVEPAPVSPVMPPSSTTQEPVPLEPPALGSASDVQAPGDQTQQ